MRKRNESDMTEYVEELAAKAGISKAEAWAHIKKLLGDKVTEKHLDYYQGRTAPNLQRINDHWKDKDPR